MLRTFRSLLLDKVDLRTTKLHVTMFAVHRHLPELTLVKPHAHPWCQALLYLEGFGEQLLGTGRARIEPGSLVMIPPKTTHAFFRQKGKTPLCVMIDFRVRDARAKSPIISALSRSELNNVKQSIAHLLHTSAGEAESENLETAVQVLQILSVLLRAAGWTPRLQSSSFSTVSQGLAALLASVDVEQPLQAMVQKSGYQRDHLNRLLKKETGLTLGQWRAQRRLAKAKELLSDGVKVGEVALATGMPDQNYFARWFRRQTGQTPTAWSRQNSE
ncbi:MAG TPA: AraC family transcriptional regulator [Opitutaceae bacterium]|nr:AraC family transcriptional regulator [Opitutaceae bacterium]